MRRQLHPCATISLCLYLGLKNERRVPQLVLSLEDGAELQQMSGSCTGESQPWETCARAGEWMSCPKPLFLPGASPGVVGLEELP